MYNIKMRYNIPSSWIISITSHLGHGQVHISETATDRVANSSPTAASMSTDLYGMAALDACEQITERLRPVAANLPPEAPFANVVKVRKITVNVSAL